MSTGTIWDELAESPEEAEVLRVRSELLRAINRYVADRGWSVEETASRLSLDADNVQRLASGSVSSFDLETLAKVGVRLGIRLFCREVR